MRAEFLDDADRYWNWPGILHDQPRHTDLAIYRQPPILCNIELHEEITRKQRTPHGLETPGMADRLFDLRQEGRETLRIETQFRFSLTVGPCVSQIPTVAPRRRDGS